MPAESLESKRYQHEFKFKLQTDFCNVKLLLFEQVGERLSIIFLVKNMILNMF